MFSLFLNIGKCELCDKPATTVWVYNGIWRTRVKMFCENHAKMYKRIKND